MRKQANLQQSKNFDVATLWSEELFEMTTQHNVYLNY